VHWTELSIDGMKKTRWPEHG